jgi:hypothetical protein
MTSQEPIQDQLLLSHPLQTIANHQCHTYRLLRRLRPEPQPRAGHRGPDAQLDYDWSPTPKLARSHPSLPQAPQSPKVVQLTDGLHSLPGLVDDEVAPFPRLVRRTPRSRCPPSCKPGIPHVALVQPATAPPGDADLPSIKTPASNSTRPCPPASPVGINSLLPTFRYIAIQYRKRL